MFKTRKKKNKKIKLDKEELEIASKALSELADGGLPDVSVQNHPVDLHVEEVCHTVNKLPDFVRKQLSKLDEYDSFLKKYKLNEKKREEAIKRKKIVEDAVISYLGEGFIVVDPNKKIVLINKRIKDIFGYDEKKNLHRDLYYKYIKFSNGLNEKVEPENDPIGYSLRTGKEVNVLYTDSYSCIKVDGTKIPITITVAPLYINNVLKGVVGIFHDASREKKLDEVKSDFISIAAHQLRTPLAISTLQTDLLLSGRVGNVDPNQEKYLREIAFSNKKISELLTNFLVASKAELGTLEINEKETSVSHLLDDVILELEPKISLKKISMLKEYGYTQEIKIDPVLIRIVLQNIISNAVRYTPENGKIKIKIKVEKNNIIVSVKDNGCGIPEADQDRVFLRMYRASNAKKQDSEGTGLGLYIAKSIIEKSGGSIRFESKEGIGTTFFVSIPIKR